MPEQNALTVSERLDRYLKAWDLSDPQLLAETVTSRVYTVTSEGTRVVLKLLSPIGIADENNGAVALRHFGGQGAVRLLRQDGEAHLLEYADGEELAEMVKRGTDDKATLIIADVLNKLHATSKDALPGELWPLRRQFRDLFSKADSDRQQGVQSVYVRGARLADALLADPRE